MNRAKTYKPYLKRIPKPIYKRKASGLGEVNMKSILTNGKSLVLACDHGLEHGPKDFSVSSINPEYILDIAVKGGFSAVVLQKGLAEKYREHYSKKIPLIVKLNGKTNIPKIEPISLQHCSVQRAYALGAVAVGYTIYLGSRHEATMFAEFGKIQEEAHKLGMAVIAWMYPRGEFVQNDKDTDILAHAARTGLELGADFVKLAYNQDPEGFKWVVKSAGRARVFMVGGGKEETDLFLKHAAEAMQAGASGLVVGRNVWQHPEPLKVASALKKVVFENQSFMEALKELE